METLYFIEEEKRNESERLLDVCALCCVNLMGKCPPITFAQQRQWFSGYEIVEISMHRLGTFERVYWGCRGTKTPCKNHILIFVLIVIRAII